MADRLSWRSIPVICALALASGLAATADDSKTAEEELPAVKLREVPAFPLEAHLESRNLVAGAMTIGEIFEAGGDLFHTRYNGLDGVGSFRLPDGTEMLRFLPSPVGGGIGAPISSQSCGRCHVGAASGPAQANVASDPNNDGQPPFNVRSTTSLFGNGILQLLAQEMTEELQAVRDQAAAEAASSPGTRVEKVLQAKGVDYGVIAAVAGAEGTMTFDLGGRRGVDPDLVVRPFGWKGNVTTVRSNTVGAAAFLMGMQAEELVWKLAAQGAPAVDPDGDGVDRELSVGDLTAMTIYGAGQETPQSVERLAELGYLRPPSDEDRARVERGRETFARIGCARCHVPEMHLREAVFEEPTARGNGHYYDRVLAEMDPSYDPARPIRLELLEAADEPRAEPHPEGGAVIRLYGDLKRHSMGRQLADPAGPQPPITANFAPLVHDGEMALIAQTDFLTPELWGVGNTGPWLHDGRAGTLREAILWHGEDDPPAVGDADRSEAQEARDAFVAAAAEDQEAVVSFLLSLRTFSPPEE